MSSSTFQRGEFASPDGQLVLPFYGYRDPATGAVWISGKSVATGLGYKDGKTSLARRVSTENRIKWRELYKDGAGVQLPDGWQPDTVMINQRGLRQLMGPKHPHLASMERLWCEYFGANPLPPVVEEIGSECSLLRLQQCEMDGITLKFRSYAEPENGEVWVVGKEVAKSLGYEKPNEALDKVANVFKKPLCELATTSTHRDGLEKTPPPIPMQTDESELSDDGVGEEVEVPKLPGHLGRLVMLNEGGVQQLILESRLPNAKRYKQWVCGTVLPSIRKTGRYERTMELEPKSCGDNSRIELLETKLALAESRSSLILAESRNALFKIEAERELERRSMEAERDKIEVERKLERSNFQLMAMQMLVSMGKRDLLSEDLQQDAKEFRTKYCDRVIPELAPHKRSCISVYSRTTELGEVQVKVSRHQMETAERVGVISKRIKAGGKLGRVKVSRRRDSRYIWYSSAEELLRLPCSNGVPIWLECKKNNPHFFYGVKFLNAHQTVIRALSEPELVEKYERDVRLDRVPDGLAGPEDVVVRCLTSPSELAGRVVRMVERVSEELNSALVVQRRLSDYSEPRAYDRAINVFNFGTMNVDNMMVSRCNF
ncbi:CUN108 putative bro protein, ATP_GTP_A motif, similar to AcMNPV ORF2 [Culex nigripalpus nucleopolyhedrovirus]|uniref:CUN108 putative bro protein, ATP_GTP_A motif, similar to AcMNPV ORF2 n=1 Tax=Culex nigripalpus nucleopolyhedrovirus (isolate Florida/1997) TaxID=645993 RepID=Q919G9_NPVCO|nr:CUN108 putative bro protein, ATP_GTP_A motif, similar to AcMNPV ORF2 [Culex nigripalpus nucleopolyhedrovirus]AAK94186.1 CUN108 putative bro protein, ATP_GTP_A motif, similar to AcMNPV ORF2 [Culex nigripalpus nucleopolyhedrovirus]